MKKNEKIFILGLVIITIIVAIVFIASRSAKKKENNQPEENQVTEEYVKVLEDGTKLNTSTKLNETKNVNGLQIGNIQLTNQNEQSVLLAEVTNNSGKDTDVILIDIILLDKNGDEIVTVGGIIAPMKQGEKTQLNTSMTLDYANAYDFKVVVK